MPTVGDILFATRSKVPDMPPALPAPTAAATVVSVTGSTLPAGTYYVQVTQRNPWGETLPSTESSIQTIGTNQGIHIVSALLPGATTIRAYLTLAGGAVGTEIQYAESTVTPFDISIPLVGFGTPPSRSTAYLMDSDGPQFGASMIYQWLNEAMNRLSRAVGGLQDYCGVPAVAGQPLYVCPGQWGEISDVWYDGYWVQGGKRAEFFRRNTISASILSNVTVSVMTDKQVLEVYPQPDRDSGVTTTTANMSATDTSVAVANPGVFLLPFGFAQIGTEIVAYSSTALGGLIRGLGSTVAKAWPSTTVVTELSLFWCGKRLTMTPYSPGDSLKDLAAPQGWVQILPRYMLALAKLSELDLESWEKLEKSFLQEAKDSMMANKPPARFIQVGGNRRLVTFDTVLGQGIVVK